MSWERDCRCGGIWPKCTESVNGGRWRTNPGLATPWRQWCREKLPPSVQKFVIAADDGFVRTWTQNDPLGVVKPLEVKTRGARPGVKDVMTLSAIQERRIAGYILVVLGGNVPGDITHWPEPCPTCSLPEALEVSDWIEVNGHRVTEEVLIELLTAHPLLETAS